MALFTQVNLYDLPQTVTATLKRCLTLITFRRCQSANTQRLRYAAPLVADGLSDDVTAET